MSDFNRAAGTARRRLADRRAVVRTRLSEIEARLNSVRSARSEWTDEEHDPEGFTLTHEWSHAEGLRAEYQHESAELDRAEARVIAGTFGICERCSLPIPDEQLERSPARRECVACTDGTRHA
jgi:RNA polymerase-binding transcription factor DksA